MTGIIPFDAGNARRDAGAQQGAPAKAMGAMKEVDRAWAGSMVASLKNPDSRKAVEAREALVNDVLKSPDGNDAMGKLRALAANGDPALIAPFCEIVGELQGGRGPSNTCRKGPYFQLAKLGVSDKLGEEQRSLVFGFLDGALSTNQELRQGVIDSVPRMAEQAGTSAWLSSSIAWAAFTDAGVEKELHSLEAQIDAGKGQAKNEPAPVQLAQPEQARSPEQARPPDSSAIGIAAGLGMPLDSFTEKRDGGDGSGSGGAPGASGGAALSGADGRLAASMAATAYIDSPRADRGEGRGVLSRFVNTVESLFKNTGAATAPPAYLDGTGASRGEVSRNQAVSQAPERFDWWGPDMQEPPRAAEASPEAVREAVRRVMVEEGSVVVLRPPFGGPAPAFVPPLQPGEAQAPAFPAEGKPGKRRGRGKKGKQWTSKSGLEWKAAVIPPAHTVKLGTLSSMPPQGASKGKKPETQPAPETKKAKPTIQIPAPAPRIIKPETQRPKKEAKNTSPETQNTKPTMSGAMKSPRGQKRESHAHNLMEHLISQMRGQRGLKPQHGTGHRAQDTGHARVLEVLRKHGEVEMLTGAKGKTKKSRPTRPKTKPRAARKAASARRQARKSAIARRPVRRALKSARAYRKTAVRAARKHAGRAKRSNRKAVNRAKARGKAKKGSRARILELLKSRKKRKKAKR